MDAEEQQIYRGVLELPFDSAPKLVYADWLEERGRYVEADNVRNHSDFPKQLQRWETPNRPWPARIAEYFPKIDFYGPFIYKLYSHGWYFRDNHIQLFQKHPITHVIIWDSVSSIAVDRLELQFCLGDKTLGASYPDGADSYRALSKKLVNHVRCLVGLSKLYEEVE